jgi:hypothetical protein
MAPYVIVGEKAVAFVENEAGVEAKLEVAKGSRSKLRRT